MSSTHVRGVAPLLLVALLAAGCASPDTPPTAGSSTPATISSTPATASPSAGTGSASASASQPSGSSSTTASALRMVSDQVLAALAEQDYAALAALADQGGVRFSPYAYVDTEHDVVLGPKALAMLAQDTTVREWGSYDGSGEPISMDWADYRDRFVWDRDFTAVTQVSEDAEIGSGNTPSNIAEAYPGAHFVEYHDPGEDPQYEGMDWRSLRLVMVPDGEDWRLVGVVHAEWTT